jgi:hypothetical protein
MNSSDFSFIPFSLTSRISCDIFIEQNLGPHIEQNGPLLPLQLEVFHHEILAVSGSNEIELIIPTEFETCFTQCIVTVLEPG